MRSVYLVRTHFRANLILAARTGRAPKQVPTGTRAARQSPHRSVQVHRTRPLSAMEKRQRLASQASYERYFMRAMVLYDRQVEQNQCVLGSDLDANMFPFSPRVQWAPLDPGIFKV